MRLDLVRSYLLLISGTVITCILSEAPPKKLTYLLSILSVEEAGKPVSKHTPVSESLELSDKEPWDTLKAQLLVKIDTALSPSHLAFDDYIVMFYISRVLPKPGMALSTNENYAALLLRAANLASKTPTINITIQQKKGIIDKENEAAPSAEVKDGGKAAKKVRCCDFNRIYVTHSFILTEKGAGCPSRERE
jgi:hypothetical protein